MGLISRLKRVTLARIELFLETVESPELVLPQLLAEMEEQVRTATRAEAKAIAAVKSAHRKVSEARGRVERLGEGAERAVEKGDEATAKDVLSAQVEAERALKRAEDALANAQVGVANSRGARKELQSELDELRVKKEEILTRARVARLQRKVEKTVHGPVASSRSILDSVAAMEARVEETEAELEVQREMAGEKGGRPSLEKRLSDLEVDADVAQRLAVLQKKVRSSKKAE